MNSSSFWYAVATLVATIVGVGIFGLPYAAWHAGFFVAALYLGVLFFVFAILHLMFGEIILRTRERHRLAGYVARYVNHGAGRVVVVTTFVGMLGGMLAYLLVGGQFLSVLAGAAGISVPLWGWYGIFWFVCTLVIAFGLKAVERSEMFMLVLMVAAVFFLFAAGVPKVNPAHFFGFTPGNFFLPYGITLFALAGTAAIPAVRDILVGVEGAMRRAIVLGTAIPVVFYLFFTAVVVGVSGPAVSEDAISGLAAALGEGVVAVGALFGILVVATSYVIFGLYLRDTLTYDLGARRGLTLLLVGAVPLVLVAAQNIGFFTLIGLLGAVVGGIESVFLVLAYSRARVSGGDQTPAYALSIPRFVLWAMIALFLCGAAYATAGEWRSLLHLIHAV